MIRKTSVEAYNNIKESGILSRMRMMCYNLLYQHGPATANQLMKIAKESNPNLSHQSIESIGRRLSELVKINVAQELGEVVCPVTNRKVILWDVTDQLPIKLEKKKTKNQIIKELKEEIDLLKTILEHSGVEYGKSIGST